MASTICFVLGGLLIIGGLLAEYTRMSASDIAGGIILVVVGWVFSELARREE